MVDTRVADLAGKLQKYASKAVSKATQPISISRWKRFEQLFDVIEDFGLFI